MSEPKVGSKPAPPPEEIRAAQAAKKGAKLTVGLFYASCKSAGVQAVTFRKTKDGDEIVLKGTIGSRTCEASLGVKEGLPFDVHAMACLETFRQGKADFIEAAVDEPDEVIELRHTVDEACICHETVQGQLTCPAHGDHPSIAASFWDENLQDVTPEQRAVMQRTQPIAGSIRKESTATASPRPKAHTDKHGRRITATGFPECLNPGCPQPVAYIGSDFCGGNCARAYHIAKAAKRQGVKLG